MLGERNPSSLVYSGCLKYIDRRYLHGRSNSVPVEGATDKEDPMGHSNCLSSEYSVSAHLPILRVDSHTAVPFKAHVCSD